MDFVLLVVVARLKPVSPLICALSAPLRPCTRSKYSLPREQLADALRQPLRLSVNIQRLIKIPVVVAVAMRLPVVAFVMKSIKQPAHLLTDQQDGSTGILAYKNGLCCCVCGT